MDSDTLFRHIVGYSLATFSAILILVIVGRIFYVLLQDIFHISINFISNMKKIPLLLKAFWLKIRDYVIIACGICVFATLIAIAFYDCYGHSNNNYHSPEEYDDALQDGKWGVPSRYRD